MTPANLTHANGSGQTLNGGADPGMIGIAQLARLRRTTRNGSKPPQTPGILRPGGRDPGEPGHAHPNRPGRAQGDGHPAERWPLGTATGTP